MTNRAIWATPTSEQIPKSGTTLTSMHTHTQHPSFDSELQAHDQDVYQSDCAESTP